MPLIFLLSKIVNYPPPVEVGACNEPVVRTAMSLLPFIASSVLLHQRALDFALFRTRYTGAETA